jgi:hypothetical protein
LLPLIWSWRSSNICVTRLVNDLSSDKHYWYQSPRRASYTFLARIAVRAFSRHFGTETTDTVVPKLLLDTFFHRISLCHHGSHFRDPPIYVNKVAGLMTPISIVDSFVPTTNMDAKCCHT